MNLDHDEADLNDGQVLEIDATEHAKSQSDAVRRVLRSKRVSVVSKDGSKRKPSPEYPPTEDMKTDDGA